MDQVRGLRIRVVSWSYAEVRGRNLVGQLRRPYATCTSRMRYLVEVELETDGRWIAEVADLPGVLAYGETRDDAVKAVVLRMSTDVFEHLLDAMLLVAGCALLWAAFA